MRNFAFFGGGISAIKSTPTVTNCTISGNLAFVGGGVDVYWAVDITFNNGILWSNEAFYGRQLFVSWCSEASLNYCCYSNRCFDVIGRVETHNCINKNPLFIDSLRGDYRLRKSSPCIDAGNDDYVLPCIGIGVREYTTDLDAEPRINDGDVDGEAVVDIGAFEFYDPTVETGQHFIAVIAENDWDRVKIDILRTMKPYQALRGESRLSVPDFTEGELVLSYTDIYGQEIQEQRTVYIDNRTREVFYYEFPVEKLQDVFGPLPSPSLDGKVTLRLDFDYWLTVRLEPVILFDNQAGVEEYETDKGTKIEVVDTSKQPPPTKEDKKEEDEWLKRIKLKDKVRRTGERSPYYNCHGWVFTCGKIWIDDEQIWTILEENGYTVCHEGRPPRVGDLVVYKKYTRKETLLLEK